MDNHPEQHLTPEQLAEIDSLTEASWQRFNHNGDAATDPADHNWLGTTRRQQQWAEEAEQQITESPPPKQTNYLPE